MTERVDVFECPGCGESMRADDPMRTLAKISAHEFLCHPPGVLEIMVYLRGGAPSRTLALWVGRSVEQHVRSLT